MPNSIATPAPESCRAAVFVGPGQPLELRRFPLPIPGPGEALVAVECCTICGSDLHTVRGARSEPIPSILGHEVLGTVASVGDPPPRGLDGVPLRPEERITWSVAVSCGDCDRCRRGLPQKCRTLFKYGHSLAEGTAALSGGLSEYLLLRRGSAVARIPNEVPAETICPVNCAAATIAAAFRAAGPVHDRRVLIQGAGALGLYAAAVARAQGAAGVTVSDPDPRRLERARQFGADSTISVPSDRDASPPDAAAGSGPAAFDVIVEVSGASAAVAAAFDLASVGGRIILVGSVLPSPAVALDPEAVVRRCLTIIGVHNYAPVDLQTAVDFIANSANLFPFAQLVERTFPLDDAGAAIDWAIRERPLRVAVRP